MARQVSSGNHQDYTEQGADYRMVGQVVRFFDFGEIALLFAVGCGQGVVIRDTCTHQDWNAAVPEKCKSVGVFRLDAIAGAKLLDEQGRACCRSR